MALGASTVWEIRQDGDDDNGGGFDETVGVDGVDYSQQAAAQLSGSDGACVAATPTTFTSATGGFTLAMEGNVIHIYDGTNLLDGWYSIETFNSSNSVTLDRTPRDGADVSAADFKVGGALASVGGLGAVFSTADEAVSGMLAFIKYSATAYTFSTTSANAAGGSFDASANSMASKRFALVGYNTTRTRANTDADLPTIDANGNTAANGAMIELAGTTTDKAQLVANIILDCDSATASGVVGSSNQHNNAINMDVTNSTAVGLKYVSAFRCKSHDNAGSGFQECRSVLCWADNNGGDGFYYADTPEVLCVASNNTGDGFRCPVPGQFACASYKNDGDGFEAMNGWFGRWVNCVSYDDGGYAFNTSYSSVLLNCASDGAASGHTNDTPALEIGKITLSVNPFTNVAAGSEDFTPNDTAGGGALLRAAGISVVDQTGYLDVGAVQHEDAGGGGTSTPTGAISQQWAR